MTRPVDSRSRLSWMDSLRGVAIFCVIVLHAVNLAALLSGVTTPRVINEFNSAVMPYRMPMLFILSGMLLSRALMKSPSQYYLGKIRNLVWPYLVWVNVYWLATMPDTIPEWHQWIATSWLWYLFNLAVYFLLAPLLNSARVPLIVVSVASFLLSVVVPGVFLTDLFLYAGYFFAGSVIWRHRHFARRFSGLGWMFLGLAAAAGLSLAYVAQYDGADLLLPVKREELLYVPLTVIGIGGLVLLAYRLPDSWSRVLRYLGRNSIVFYLIHFPLQILIAHVLGALGEWRWQAHIGLGVMLPLVIGALLAVLRRFPVVDALFAMPSFRARASSAP